MNPHRPRKPREEGAALRYLPCRYQPGVEARDRLEALIHNGGRRAHKLRVAVAELDER